MKPPRIFPIFYRVFFGILYLAITGLLIISPADVIVQVRNNSNTINQVRYYVVVGGCYGLTGFLAACIYFNRIQTNKAALKDIPKTFIPIGKGEVSTKTQRMIETSLRRSLAIAWDSRPRIPPQLPTTVNDPEAKDNLASIPGVDLEETEKGKKREHTFSHRGHITANEHHVITIPTPEPVWGEILHNGWSSPTSPDLPNLQYMTVILELPHLIEARAVSMAPADPASTLNPPTPDFQAVDILQRPAALGLRDYIGHLTSVGVFTTSTTDFLTAYEYARFAPQPLTETEFRRLMSLFADVLRDIQPLSPAILTSFDLDSSESDIDDDASSTSTPRSRSIASVQTSSSRTGSEGTIRTAPSRRVSPPKTWRSIAPATPKSRKNKTGQTRPPVSRSISMNSFVQSRRLHNGSAGGSSESLGRSTSQGSVIRLSNTNESGQLPYTLTIPGLP